MSSHSVSFGVAVSSSINMYCRILAIFAISLTIPAESNGAPALSKARQLLPALPGYIPVYIRSGDTPLEEINPDLAAAFDSYAHKHSRFIFGRSLDDIKKQLNSSESATVVKVKDESLVPLDEDLSLEEENDVEVSTQKTLVNESQHIQKIPRS